MSSISPIYIQHIVQMGTATEKLQHSLQNLPQANGQHSQEERKTADELKRLSVQDPEVANQSVTVNPEGSKGKERRKGKQKDSSDSNEDEEIYKRKIIALEENQGKTIDVVV